MAWIMWGSGENEAHPRQDVNAEDEAQLRDVGRALLARHTELDPADPLFEPRVGSMRPDVGIRYPDPDGPIRIHITKIFAPLTDFVATFGGPAINERVREAIEAIEPGVHRYFPVEFTLPDGAPGEPYWLLNIATRIDSIAIDRCTGIEDVEPYPEQLPGYRIYRGDLLRSKTTLALHADAIRGRAVWWESKLRQKVISNSFNDFVIASGIRGLERNTLLVNELQEV